MLRAFDGGLPPPMPDLLHSLFIRLHIPAESVPDGLTIVQSSRLKQHLGTVAAEQGRFPESTIPLHVVLQGGLHVSRAIERSDGSGASEIQCLMDPLPLKFSIGFACDHFDNPRQQDVARVGVFKLNPRAAEQRHRRQPRRMGLIVQSLKAMPFPVLGNRRLLLRVQKIGQTTDMPHQILNQQLASITSEFHLREVICNFVAHRQLPLVHQYCCTHRCILLGD